jgi:hypothetical protein
MPTTSPYRVTPALGPDITQVVKSGTSWYDRVASPAPGETVHIDDGRKAIWVQASATIVVAASPGTQIALTVNATDPRVTAATGAGGYYAPHTGFYTGTIVSGDRFWAIQGTAP